MDRFTKIAEGAALTFGEIQKYDWRIAKVIDKMKRGEPFDTKKGAKIILYSADVERALKTNNKKFARARLKTADGAEISFGDIIKTKEFGGGTSGSGGGSDNTTATESAQCVYAQAIWDNPRTTFSPSELAKAYRKCDVDATTDQILNIGDDWVQSSIMGAKLLKRVLGGKQYTWHRGSSWVTAMDSRFKRLNKKDRFFTNLNKWTPADIWIVASGADSKYDFDSAESLVDLNNMLLQAYAARDVLGISLKKIGNRPKIVQVNYKKPFKAPVFSKVTYGKKGYWNAKDGYIMYNDGEIQFRTYPEFQCEIIGRTAKHGKVSFGPMQSLLRQNSIPQMEDRNDIRREWRQDPGSVIGKWYGLYGKTNNPMMTLEEFTAEANQKDDNWVTSKYLVTKLFLNIKGKEQAFLEDLYRYAKSQSITSAVHLKLL